MTAPRLPARSIPADAPAPRGGSGNGGPTVADQPDSKLARLLVQPQVSESGTPNYLGYTSPDEYVEELRWPQKRMEIFEEMRASDEAINTAIEARVKLISGADWRLSTPDTKDARQVEILEFCEDNIYPVLDDLLKHLADGALQYGFGMVEPVFQWSDEPFARNILSRFVRRSTIRREERMIYLRKLAHVRQRTIDTFKLHMDGPRKGDLESAIQFVYDVRGATKTVAIPAAKVLLWPYNRQGDDYWGRAPTRHVYRVWSFKRQLENLNLLQFERFGVGVPVITAGPGWVDDDYTKAENYLKNFRSSANGFLILPFGGTLDLKTGEGGPTDAAREWTKWYTLAIAKTWLTQQTELGSTETGARAVGEVMYEHMEQAVQDDCDSLSNLLNERLIVSLVNINYGPQEVYPSFAPSQRVRGSPVIAQVVASLISAGALGWDAADEGWLREKLEMPEIDIEERQAEMDEEALIEEERAQQMVDAQVDSETASAEEKRAKAKATTIPPQVGKPGANNASTQKRAKARIAARLQDEAQGRETDRQRGDGDAAPRPGSVTSEEREPASRGRGRRTRSGGPRPFTARLSEVAKRSGSQEGSRGRTSLADPVGGAGDAAGTFPGAPSHTSEPKQVRIDHPRKKTYRSDAYTEWELRIVRPDVLARDLDLEEARVAAEVQQVLADIDAYLVSRYQALAEQGPRAVADGAASVVVSTALRTRLRATLATAAERSRTYGRKVVRNEFARQAEPAEASEPRFGGYYSAERERDERSFWTKLAHGFLRAFGIEQERTALQQPDGSLSPDEDREARDLEIDAAIDRAVEDEIDRREGAARTAVLAALATGATRAIAELVTIIAARLRDALAALSTGRTRDTAGQVVNVAFGAGRADTAEEREAESPDDIVAEVYSAVMDFGTCDVCARYDGAEFPPGYSRSGAPGGVQAPNPRCEGGYGRCRCIWVYVLRAERPSEVGATRGPGRTQQSQVTQTTPQHAEA